MLLFLFWGKRVKMSKWDIISCMYFCPCPSALSWGHWDWKPRDYVSWHPLAARLPSIYISPLKVIHRNLVREETEDIIHWWQWESDVWTSTDDIRRVLLGASKQLLKNDSIKCRRLLRYQVVFPTFPAPPEFLILQTFPWPSLLNSSNSVQADHSLYSIPSCSMYLEWFLLDLLNLDYYIDKVTR